MSPISHAFNENSLLGTCMSLAQSTFQQSMPGTFPATLPVDEAPQEGFWHRLAEKFDAWCYRQQLAQREAYLGQSQDICDLERRMRQIERAPYF